MNSLNKLILLGLVGHDPELKVTTIGIPVGTFKLATDEPGKYPCSWLVMIKAC
jgi:single-stranded DNA-binding protein